MLDSLIHSVRHSLRSLALAPASSMLISLVLCGVRFSDLWAFAGAASVLVAVVLFACWIPARRAARIDPILALRHD